MIEAAIAAFVVGLLGAGHCLGMCGGIASALGFAFSPTPDRSRILLLACYNLGRVLSYSLIGLAAGWLGGSLTDQGGLPMLRTLAGAMLILLGFYLANWWQVLVHLERIGARLWRFVKPLTDKLIPVTSFWQALLLGGLWGWLPCGLIYSALVLAAAQGSAMGGATTMFAFGLGTLPAIVLSGFLALRLKRLLQWQPLRWLNGAMLIVFGAWTIWAAYQHNGHHHVDNNEPAETSQHHHH